MCPSETFAARLLFAFVVLPFVVHSAHAAPLTVEKAWQWGPTVSQAPSNATDVWSSPVVARIFDTNGDGRVNTGDDPSLILVSGNTIDPVTGRGQPCQSTPTIPSACHTGTLRLLNARTGEEQFSLERLSPTSAGFAGITPAILPSNGGEPAKIAAVTAEGYVAVLGASASAPPGLSVIGTSDQPIPGSNFAVFGRGGALSVTEDGPGGLPGLAYGSTVFSVTAAGVMRVFTGSSGYGSPMAPGGALSTFGNLDGTGGDELLAGRTAYRSDGTLLWNNIHLPDGYVALADLNGDGALEVVLVGQTSLWILRGATGEQLIAPFTLPGDGLIGPPVIADFDGDGKLEIGIARANVYSVVKPDFVGSVANLLWQRPVVNSGGAGKGAAAPELGDESQTSIVYADSCFMLVLDGLSGAVRFAAPHTAFGSPEWPVAFGIGDTEFLVMTSTGIDPSASGYRCMDASGMPITVDGVSWVGSDGGHSPYRGITVFAISYEENNAGVPVPGTLTLLSLGLACLAATRRRRT